MKTYLDCIPCFLRQTLEGARIATDDEKVQKKIIDKVCEKISTFPLSHTPPEMGSIIHKIIRETSGMDDPYKALKEKYNRLGENLYPKLKDEVKNAQDSLLKAIRFAIAGNIIDFGALSTFNLDKEVEDVITQEFAIFDYLLLKKRLNRVDEILYLADNAGEVYFDRLLIEELNKRDKKVVYAVKEAPAINDALREDAEYCGIDKIAQVISSGAEAPGTILDLCSDEFKQIFYAANLIISKGQGNFEALDNTTRPIAFLLKAKCPIIAKDLNCSVGDIILKFSYT